MMEKCSRTIATFLTLLIIIALISACTQSKEKQILGKWASKKASIEFFDDGTFVTEDNTAGNYNFLNSGNRIKLDLGYFARVAYWKVEDDQLTLVFDKEDKLILERTE